MENRDKLTYSRRKFLKSAGVMLMTCGLNGKYVTAASTNKPGFTVLDKNDRFDIGGRGKEIIQKAYELGFLFEDKYKGCARCTIAALQDAIDFIPADEELFRAASCLVGVRPLIIPPVAEHLQVRA